MEISCNQDIYNNVDLMIQKLKKYKEDDYANALTNALVISGMPGEILGQLRIELKLLSKSKVPKEIGIEKDVLELIHYINIAFNQ